MTGDEQTPNKVNPTVGGRDEGGAVRRDKEMSRSATLFVLLVCLFGFLTGAVTLAQADWRSGSIFQFIVYLVLAAFASRLKVRLPGVAGTLSVNFIFVLLSVVELRRVETLIISCLAAAVQCLAAAKSRPKPAKVAFNIGNSALCGVLCDIVYHAPLIRMVDGSMPVSLFCATSCYFLANTLIVSGIIALTENKRTWTVWRDNFFWTGPQYIFGAGLAGLIHVCNGHFGWQYSILVFPGIYLLDRSYRLYLSRLQEEKEHLKDKEEAYLQLAQAQQHLMAASRQAGMAEVATSVLHNVGNVLNSVNVSATIVADKIQGSPISNLAALASMLQEHSGDLPDFLQRDPKGQRVVPYLEKLARRLGEERQVMLGELKLLTAHIGHIKEIVATQQSYGKVSGLIEVVSLPELVEDATRILGPGLDRHGIHLELDCEAVPPVAVDKHSILQILLNLLRNAKQAVENSGKPERVIRVRIGGHGDDRVRIEVTDNGVGIAPDDLTRIFAHGFTTKKDGHGFGLHSGALAAKQSGGSLSAASEGPGLGATFTLELPLAPAKGKAPICSMPEGLLTGADR